MMMKPPATRTRPVATVQRLPMRAARKGTKGESTSMGIIMGMMAKEVLKAPKPITSMNSWLTPKKTPANAKNASVTTRAETPKALCLKRRMSSIGCAVLRCQKTNPVKHATPAIRPRSTQRS